MQDAFPHALQHNTVGQSREMMLCFALVRDKDSFLHIVSDMLLQDVELLRSQF